MMFQWCSFARGSTGTDTTSWASVNVRFAFCSVTSRLNWEYLGTSCNPRVDVWQRLTSLCQKILTRVWTACTRSLASVASAVYCSILFQVNYVVV